MPTELARLDHINLTIGSREILRDVSLKLYPGKVLTIIGPNGAGKSTLIRILLGLQQADSGQIFLRNKLRLSYVPQKLQFNHLLPLTVTRFVALAQRFVKSKQIMAVLQEIGICHIAQQSMESLSGGELQRVLLARALLRDPELLILDEPAQGVDIAGQSELYQLIARLKTTRNCSILMVSHDLHLVMANSDQVLCLNQHICCRGLPEDVSIHPEYQKLFGNLSQTGIAVYTHHHDHKHDVHGCVVPLTTHKSQDKKDG